MVVIDSLNEDWRQAILQAIELVGGSDEKLREIGAGLANLQMRLDSGRFHLAVLGQFKRGKSTFLNALLGEALLPTSVVPLTALPTWIQAADKPQVRCVFQDGSFQEINIQHREDIARILTHYATEEGNPENHLGVVEITLNYPSSFLAEGVVLIDTPGIGSTLRHNTETTLQFLPKCDAGVFLLSADPPITEIEVDFLKTVQSKIPKLFFVINKIDYLDMPGRLEVLRFLKHVLREHSAIEDETPVFCISARAAVEARQAGDAEKWKESGFEAVERHLIDFLVRDKRHALQSAIRQKAHDMVAGALLWLRLTHCSLQMPLEDLQSRMAAFEAWLIQMRHEHVAIHDQLAGDRRRLHRLLEDESGQLQSRAAQALHGVLNAELIRLGNSAVDESALQDAMQASIPPLFKDEFESVVTHFQERIRQLSQRYEDHTDSLVDSVRRTAAGLFDIPFHPSHAMHDMEAGRMPYWLTYRWDYAFGLISPSLVDRFMPQRFRARRIEKRFRRKIESLAVTNAGKLREALANQIDTAMTACSRKLDQRVNMAVEATRSALETAIERRKHLSEQSAQELARLAITIQDLEECRKKLAS